MDNFRTGGFTTLKCSKQPSNPGTSVVNCTCLLGVWGVQGCFFCCRDKTLTVEVKTRFLPAHEEHIAISPLSWNFHPPTYYPHPPPHSPPQRLSSQSISFPLDETTTTMRFKLRHELEVVYTTKGFFQLLVSFIFNPQ